MVENKFHSLLDTARANLKESAECLADSPVSLNEKIEWLKGWMQGYYSAMDLDRVANGRANRAALEEFLQTADKVKHKITLKF